MTATRHLDDAALQLDDLHRMLCSAAPHMPGDRHMELARCLAVVRYHLTRAKFDLQRMPQGGDGDRRQDQDAPERSPGYITITEPVRGA